jgi:hypothetical protein
MQDNPIGDFRRGLDEGELERDLALEVARERLVGMDDGELVLAFGTLLGEAADRVTGSLEFLLALADAAFVVMLERLAPRALEEARELAT